MRAQTLDRAAADQAFIRATEVWIPDPMGETLIRADGLYGPLDSFDDVSAGHGFARGEGLPGRAWTEARPIVLTDLQTSAFLRARAAGQAGLQAAVAVPVFCRSALKGVLVLFCGADDTRVGATEIWRGDEASGGPMRLDGGY